MSRIVALCVCLLIGTAQANTHKPLDLIFDKHLSPYSGSGITLSMMSLYKLADETWIPPLEGERTWTTVGLRAAKSLLLEGTISSWLMVYQHEYFGHGWQARKNHVTAHYNFSPFKGTTTYDISEYNAQPAHQQIRMTTSGIESSQILSEQLRYRWLETGTIDNRDAMLYLLSKADETDYITDFRDGKPTTTLPLADKHDLDAYIRQVNNWHNQTVIRGKRLRKRIFYEYLDPFLIYSFISTFQTIWNGTSTWDYPVLSLSDLQYLPSIKSIYAPYGPELQLNNYLIGPNQNYYLHIRYGKNGHLHSHGIQLKLLPFFQFMDFKFNGHFDAWRQPKLFTSSSDNAKRMLGGAASVHVNYQGLQNTQLGLQFGYKSQGYIPGEQLEQGPIFRLFVQFMM